MAIWLLAFFGVFFALAFLMPSYRLWRKHGINALVLPRDDTALGFVGILFRRLIAGIFLLLTTLSLGLPASTTGALAWLESHAVLMLGWAVLATSLAWTVAAQAQMGASWRIGIDANTPSDLVTSEIFALSRNPVFLGMRASLLGLFLVLPNAFTLAILLLGEVLMQTQVRLEEDHLRLAYGEAYETYTRQVRRWL